MLVVAWSEAGAAAIRARAAARAAAGGNAVRLASAAAPLTDPHALADILGRHRPAVCLVCASAHAPSEAANRPSAWTDLIARARLGLTLPLQVGVAMATARAVADRTPGTVVVNACFPDAVNPVLARLGLPVLAGIGNVGTIAAAAQAALGRPDQSGLRILAHHSHLHGPPVGCPEVRGWRDGDPIQRIGRLLAEQRSASRSDLNGLAGAGGTALVNAVLTGADLDTHLPGPLGLPGGYPVSVRGARVGLRLPAGVSRSAAVSWNCEAGRYDGVELRPDGHLRFRGPTRAELARHLPDLADGFPVEQITAAARALARLRDRLRRLPADAAG